jgi:two-component system LytT family response regulator
MAGIVYSNETPTSAEAPVMPPRLRVLIVDDEPLARERIRSLLNREEAMEVIGECGDGQEAVTAIQELRPDLVFLDVQMPKLDGFDVLEALEPERMPTVIFVTAYDRYALKAFEVHAFDYLLKPFDRDRFRKAIQRVRSQFDKREPKRPARVRALLHDVKDVRKPLERIIIKSGGRVYFVRTEEIDWIEAAGNYLRLHVGGNMHLLRDTMTGIEGKLDAGQFVRIHRSTIVNVERIQELQPWFHGDYVVILRDGTQLTMSRSFRPRFQELFGSAL